MSGRLICLASYPKSGNTWLRAMLAAYLRRDRALDINAILFSVHASKIGWIDAQSGLRCVDFPEPEAMLIRRATLTELGKQPGDPVFLKTHDANLPLSDGRPTFEPEAVQLALCPLRHPYDVAISFGHHLGRADDMAGVVAMMCDPGAYLSRKMGARFPELMSDWSGNIRSWTDSGLNTHVIRYEDMLVDPLPVLRRAAALCWPAAPLDEVALASACAQTGFAQMQAQEEEHSFLERPLAATRFFREGRAGGGAALPLDLRMQLWEAHHRVMIEYGYRKDGSTEPES